MTDDGQPSRSPANKTRPEPPEAAWGGAFILSLVITAAFYAVFYGILHPGYAILDDLKIISILVGYPGVQPAPFLIFSNVLLGLALLPLYDLHTGINWEIVLFSLINMLAVWMLLYLLLSSRAPRTEKLLGAVLLLACGSYYGLNLTFSSTAALACFAGLCAIAGQALQGGDRRTVLGATGIGLVFLGSLVRIQMLFLTLPLVAVAVVCLYRRMRLGALAILAVFAVLFVAGGYSFDRLYVRAHPDWNKYYFYNLTAQAVQDSHRLENMHLEIRRIGWSANDQELFARSFFPDPGTYSVDRLKYLVNRVSGIGNDPIYSAESVLSRIASIDAAPFLLVSLATWLWVLALHGRLPAKLGIPLVTATSIAEAIGLTWIYKDPQYVLLASLANTAMLSIVLSSWTGSEAASALSPETGPSARMIRTSSIIVAAAAIAIAGFQAIVTSNGNLQRQAIYSAILTDIAELQAAQKLPADAVLISPAYGIPVDWANPFVVAFPQIPYLDTGWSTFSPPYEQALRNFGITSLPEALYQKPNVYVMSETILKDFLRRYYQEHEGFDVRFESLFTYGYPDRYAGYHEVELYKVEKVP